MRPRTRFAVSVFFDQIGSRIRTSMPVSTSATRHLADGRIDIGFEGGSPLLGMLGILPARSVSVDIGLCLLPERHHLHLSGALLDALGLARFDGVDPCRVKLASFQGGLAGFREAERDDRAEPHVAGHDRSA